MSSILEWFNNNSWLNLISFVIGILGIFLAYYFYKKSLKEKKPIFLTETISLFHANPIIAKRIEIRYNGSQVESLSLTKFAFWNAGTESIRREDMVVNAPLLIRAKPEVNILDFEVTRENKDNNFSIQKIDEHTLRMEFDFIDQNDGIAINIFHNNVRGHKFIITGTFIGAKRLREGLEETRPLVVIDKLAYPVNYFLGKKSFFMKLIAGLLVLPTLILLIIPGIIFGPIDTYQEKKNRAIRKKFLFGS